MKTRTVVLLSAVIEAVTGVALIAAPDLVARLLLGVDLSSSGIAVARVGGIALLSLAIACSRGDIPVASQVIRALFAYNLLAALYLGYLRIGGGFVAFLLWPACALHAVLAILLALPAYESTRSKGQADSTGT